MIQQLSYIVELYIIYIYSDFIPRHSLGEALWEATGSTVHTQEPVLKINARLPNEIMSWATIPVHDSDGEGVVEGENSWEMKHLTKDWVDLTGDVVVLVIDFCLSNLYLQEWIRLRKSDRMSVRGEGWEVSRCGVW